MSIIETEKLQEVALRIREMREIFEFSVEAMAEKTEVSLDEYRLYENGFTFNDYYQPTWGGSTSTGEFSIFSGIIPTSGVGSMLKLTAGNTDFTIGNKLMAEGYFSASYHKGRYILELCCAEACAYGYF